MWYNEALRVDSSVHLKCVQTKVPDHCDSTTAFVTWLYASHTKRDCGSKEVRGMGSHLRTRTADSLDVRNSIQKLGDLPLLRSCSTLHTALAVKKACIGQQAGLGQQKHHRKRRKGRWGRKGLLHRDPFFRVHYLRSNQVQPT
jgi:hypothetical protein